MCGTDVVRRCGDRTTAQQRSGGGSSPSAERKQRGSSGHGRRGGRGSHGGVAARPGRVVTSSWRSAVRVGERPPDDDVVGDYGENVDDIKHEDR